LYNRVKDRLHFTTGCANAVVPTGCNKKNRLPYNLYCVGGDVKHCSLTHSVTNACEVTVNAQLEKIGGTGQRDSRRDATLNAACTEDLR